MLSASSSIHSSLVLASLANDSILLLLQKLAAPDEVVDVVALLQACTAVKYMTWCNLTSGWEV